MIRGYITLNWRVSVQSSQISNCIVAQTDWTLIRWPLASLLFTYNLVFIFVMGHGYWIYTYFLFPLYGLKFCVLLLKINHGCMLGVSLIWILRVLFLVQLGDYSVLFLAGCKILAFNLGCGWCNVYLIGFLLFFCWVCDLLQCIVEGLLPFANELAC